MYLRKTGIRAWKLLTSTKSPRVVKVSPVRGKISLKVHFNLNLMHCPEKSDIKDLFHACSCMYSSCDLFDYQRWIMARDVHWTVPFSAFQQPPRLALAAEQRRRPLAMRAKEVTRSHPLPPLGAAQPPRHRPLRWGGGPVRPSQQSRSAAWRGPSRGTPISERKTRPSCARSSICQTNRFKSVLRYIIFQKCLHPVGKFGFMIFYQPFRSETGSRTGGWSWRGRCRTRWLMPVRQMLSLRSCITQSYRPTGPGPTPGPTLPRQQ